jgi:hypothetical protein
MLTFDRGVADFFGDYNPGSLLAILENVQTSCEAKAWDRL